MSSHRVSQSLPSTPTHAGSTAIRAPSLGAPPMGRTAPPRRSAGGGRVGVVSACVVGLLVASPASAGEGPWTVSAGDHTLYLGGDWGRWQDYRGGSGDPQSLGPGVSRGGGLGVWTAGIREGLDVEISVPFQTVRVDDPQAANCTGAPRAGWCATTQGVGRMSLMAKLRLVDEVFRPPVTLSLVGGLETGEHTARYRGRLTNLGEGQSDALAGISMGHSSRAGDQGGWFRAHLTALAALRAGLVGEGFDKVPGNELRAQAGAMWSPRGHVGIGLGAYGFHRLSGDDIGDVSLDSPNGFAQLASTQVSAGLKVHVASEHHMPSLNVSVFRSVVARNAPSDELTVGAGLGWNFPRIRDDPFEP